MTPAQCREARALVGLSQAELARLAIVPKTFVADFEGGAMTLMQADLEALKRALEHLGVEFIDGRSSGGEAEVLKETAFGKPGARLKEQEKRAMKQPQHQIVGLIKQNPPGLREKVDAVMTGHLQQGTDPASISDERERIAKAVLEILPDLSLADWVAFYIRNPRS